MYDEYSGEPVWAYVKDTWEISEWTIKDLGIKLTKDSQYTVSLTPIYGENKAKPATTKVKTTIWAMNMMVNGLGAATEEAAWILLCRKAATGT